MSRERNELVKVRQEFTELPEENFETFEFTGEKKDPLLISKISEGAILIRYFFTVQQINPLTDKSLHNFIVFIAVTNDSKDFSVGENQTTENNDAVEEIAEKNHICSQLSSVRDEIQEFCEGMEKFTKKNEIIYENGNVVGFWGNRTTQRDANSREEDTEGNLTKNDTRWWSAKERKIKVRSILKERESAAGEIKEKLENEIQESNLEVPKKEATEVDDAPNSCLNEDTRVSILTTAIDSLVLGGPENVLQDRQDRQSSGGKRAHEIDRPEVSRKKFLIGESGAGDPEWPRRSESDVDIMERCRRHAIRETRKHTARASPLIDSCISNLINETSNKLSLMTEENQKEENLRPCIAPINISEEVSELGAEVIGTKEDRVSWETGETNIGSIDSLEESLARDSSGSGDGAAATIFVEVDNNQEKRYPAFLPRIDEEIEGLSTQSDPGPDDMDAALRARITKSVNAPKTAEQRERGRRSASLLINRSREAMALGRKPPQDVPPVFDHSQVC